MVNKLEKYRERKTGDSTIGIGFIAPKKASLRREIKNRIISCHEGLLARNNLNYKNHLQDIFYESWRARLDELLLLWSNIKNQSFIESCNEFNIEYRDVDLQEYHHG